MKKNTVVGISAILVALAITAGALGAHALKAVLTPALLDSFKTGVQYLLLMSLAVLLLNLQDKIKLGKSFNLLCLGGACLFSFSIFLLSTQSLWLAPKTLSFLGPLTPLGGVAMITAWVILGLKAFKKQ